MSDLPTKPGRRRKPRSAGIEAILRVTKTFERLAEIAETSVQAVAQWKEVPAGRCLQIEAATGVPREVMRPDVYGPPRGRRAA